MTLVPNTNQGAAGAPSTNIDARTEWARTHTEKWYAET